MMTEPCAYDCSGWSVSNIEEQGQRYVIYAEQPSLAKACCYCDGGVVNFGQVQRRVHDLPLNGQPVIVLVRHQRYRCRKCKSTFRDALLGVDKKHQTTIRLIAYICEQAERRTRASVAAEVGISEGAVRLMLRTTN